VFHGSKIHCGGEIQGRKEMNLERRRAKTLKEKSAKAFAKIKTTKKKRRSAKMNCVTAKTFDVHGHQNSKR
jgi:hypothetical protein